MNEILVVCSCRRKNRSLEGIHCQVLTRFWLKNEIGKPFSQIEFHFELVSWSVKCDRKQSNWELRDVLKWCRARFWGFIMNFIQSELDSSRTGVITYKRLEIDSAFPPRIKNVNKWKKKSKTYFFLISKITWMGL